MAQQAGRGLGQDAVAPLQGRRAGQRASRQRSWSATVSGARRMPCRARRAPEACSHGAVPPPRQTHRDGRTGGDGQRAAAARACLPRVGCGRRRQRPTRGDSRRRAAAPQTVIAGRRPQQHQAGPGRQGHHNPLARTEHAKRVPCVQCGRRGLVGLRQRLARQATHRAGRARPVAGSCVCGEEASRASVSNRPRPASPRLGATGHGAGHGAGGTRARQGGHGGCAARVPVGMGQAPQPKLDAQQHLGPSPAGRRRRSRMGRPGECRRRHPAQELQRRRHRIPRRQAPQRCQAHDRSTPGPCSLPPPRGLPRERAYGGLPANGHARGAAQDSPLPATA
jgi:hypothetical protein